MTAYHFPLQPLVDYIETRYRHDFEQMVEGRDGRMRPNDQRVADLIGLDRSAVVAYRQRGIPLTSADAIATRLGLHPVLLWPEYGEVPINPVHCYPKYLQGYVANRIKLGRPHEHLLDRPARRTG